MMRTLLTFTLLAIGICSHAQTPAKFYYDKAGIQIEDADKAKFSRTLTPLPDGYFDVKEHYPDNILKLEGKATSYDPLKFDGIIKEYSEKGILSSEKNYVKGMKIGEARGYWTNGKLKETTEYFYPGPIDSSVSIPFPKIKMISYFDSTGVQLLKDGNGYVEWKSGDWLEKGKYVAGFKDSIWTGENLKSGTRYKEVYTDKKMLSGTTFKGGKTYTYSEGEGMPIYPGGLKEFYKFVGKTYRYPLAAVKRGTTGRVLLSFVVEKDGSITDIKIIKDIGFGTGREAARVMRNSPNWIPGTQRGLPVRVQYTLPIVLAL